MRGGPGRGVHLMSNENHTSVDVLIEPSDRAVANCQVTDLEGFWFPPHPMVMLIPPPRHPQAALFAKALMEFWVAYTGRRVTDARHSALINRHTVPIKLRAAGTWQLQPGVPSGP